MSRSHVSMDAVFEMNRREFVQTLTGCTATAGALMLGTPLSGQEKEAAPEVATNIAEFLKVPKTPHSLPGPFPGRVVKVTDPRSLVDEKVDAKVVAEMVERGIRSLTGTSMKKSFRMFFTRDDVVGLKVNPVGPPLISTKPEVVEAVIRWLVDNKLPASNIVIWDRFDLDLKDAGFTQARFPGVRIDALQTMVEEGHSFRDATGNHISRRELRPRRLLPRQGSGREGRARLPGRRVLPEPARLRGRVLLLRQAPHPGASPRSSTSRRTRTPATASRWRPRTSATPPSATPAGCTRRSASRSAPRCSRRPVVRDKLVLNITDGLRGQYDGGPDKNEKFIYPNHSLYFATDPFALDAMCHRELVAKRKEMGIAVNEHPRFTEYLHYAEKLGLGVADPAKITLVRA